MPRHGLALGEIFQKEGHWDVLKGFLARPHLLSLLSFSTVDAI